ncbi:MAG: nitronate monooxygenase [Minisyncoccia bacterium]
MRRRPKVIQAGMGVGVSSWLLANKCARSADVQGTVSGVAAQDIVVRTLQRGDPGGDMRRALAHFPVRHYADLIVDKFYVEGGIPEDKKFRGYPVFTLTPSEELQRLMIISGFVLVWLAKEGHDGVISVNYLEKIQMVHIYYILGAMLAGVDVITMGAGMINQIPKLVDNIVAGVDPSYKVKVIGADEPAVISYNPEKLFGQKLPIMKRPDILAIVSSNVLAKSLMKSCPGGIDGFVIEYPIAGGHNAPPRKKGVFDDKGQPIYAEAMGEKDWVDLEEFRGYGIPFWLAGGYASPEGLKKALTEGASGIQVGSMFALCDDSGMLPELRNEARMKGFKGELEVLRSMRSPTGYPFMVAELSGTLSDTLVYKDRERNCSICALRDPKKLEDKIVYVCSSEPVDDFEKKGGKREETFEALCLCNALLATIGLGNRGEPPVVTMGQDTSFLPHLMKDENDSYTAVDAIRYLLSSSR